ncbi:uncharacterized protein LOC101854910 [Aplysia californica]|uniref:Uncharacterized protein LOC101854910 n=1 Tax=Aplysia californica TaxID=6500 RepID=A0ABM0K8G7_APLCA|nr:uncharacterized protein LOC101854910 [Aplysia californica]
MRHLIADKAAGPLAIATNFISKRLDEKVHVFNGYVIQNDLANGSSTNTGDSNDVKMEDTMEFRVATALWIYVAPAILVVGTVGSLVSLLVLCQPSMRRQSTMFYLSMLAVGDLMVLYTGLVRLWLEETQDIYLRLTSSLACRAHTFFVYLSLDFSVWVLVAVCIDRCLIVSWPHRAKRWCSRKRALCAVVAIFVVMAAINAHFFWTYGLETQQEESRIAGDSELRCYMDLSSPTSVLFIQKVWPWIDLCVYFLIPFVLILACNVIIIRQLVRSDRKMADHRRRSGRSKVMDDVPQKGSKTGQSKTRSPKARCNSRVSDFDLNRAMSGVSESNNCCQAERVVRSVVEKHRTDHDKGQINQVKDSINYRKDLSDLEQDITNNENDLADNKKGLPNHEEGTVNHENDVFEHQKDLTNPGPSVLLESGKLSDVTPLESTIQKQLRRESDDGVTASVTDMPVDITCRGAAVLSSKDSHCTTSKNSVADSCVGLENFSSQNELEVWGVDDGSQTSPENEGKLDSTHERKVQGLVVTPFSALYLSSSLSPVGVDCLTPTDTEPGRISLGVGKSMIDKSISDVWESYVLDEKKYGCSAGEEIVVSDHVCSHGKDSINLKRNGYKKVFVPPSQTVTSTSGRGRQVFTIENTLRGFFTKTTRERKDSEKQFIDDVEEEEEEEGEEVEEEEENPRNEDAGPTEQVDFQVLEQRIDTPVQESVTMTKSPHHGSRRRSHSAKVWPQEETKDPSFFEDTHNEASCSPVSMIKLSLQNNSAHLEQPGDSKQTSPAWRSPKTAQNPETSTNWDENERDGFTKYAMKTLKQQTRIEIRNEFKSQSRSQPFTIKVENTRDGSSLAQSTLYVTGTDTDFNSNIDKQNTTNSPQKKTPAPLSIIDATESLRNTLPSKIDTKSNSRNTPRSIIDHTASSKNTSPSALDATGSSTKNPKHVPKRQTSKTTRSTSSVSKTLIAITVAFLLLNSPINVYIIVYTYVAEENQPLASARLHLGWTLTNCLMYLNQALHVFLYCLTGPRFRQELAGIEDTGTKAW